MTTAVGHGKKAARNIDAFLRGKAYTRPPDKHPIVPFEELNLPVFLDAARQEAPEVPITQRTGFEEVTHGLTESEARHEARRCLSLRQLLRMRQLLRRLSRAGDREARRRSVLPHRLRLLHGLRRLLRAVPVPRDRDDPRSRRRRLRTD